MKHAGDFFSTARAREAIRRRRVAGYVWPWTDDKVFRDWRFCNVHREHDRTTAWFREHVREPLRRRRTPVIEAVIAFRWFNRIATGETLKPLLLGGWNGAEARRLLAVQGDPVFTGAYIIKSPDGMSKVEGILWCIERALFLMAAPRSQHWGPLLRATWYDLKLCPFLGGFMAYEIVSDLRWTDVLSEAGDIRTWANAGPGCARGLGYVVRADPDSYVATSAHDQTQMLSVMRELLTLSREEEYWPQAWDPWEMREVEHWACEYWKYIRCRDFNQPPRGRYRSPEGALFNGSTVRS